MSRHLEVSIDRESRIPIAQQARDAIRRLIEEDVLQPATRLPSSRRLGIDLGVSRSVVVEAYEQLIAEGYLVAQRGSGTSVAPSLRPRQESVLAAPQRAAARWDLRTGGCDASAFPRQEWLRCMTAVISAAGPHELGYTAPAGVPSAREAVAAYLSRVRGVRARADRLMMTAGFAQGLALVCAVLREAGHETVAVEDPGHPGERPFMSRAGLRAVGVPVDAEGIVVDELYRTGARAVVTTPACHFPTGVPLSAARRAALVEWAHRVDGFIIEDDFESAYVSATGRGPALQSLAPDRVVYAGSASKVLAPTLRLGWLVVPAPLMERLEYVRSSRDFGSSGLDQLAFARFLETGAFDRHLRRMRDEMRQRREQVHDDALRALPGARALGADSGLQAYLQLPGGCDETALVRAAEARSVLVHGGQYYRLDRTDLPASVVVCFATLHRTGLTRAIEALGSAYRDVTGRRCSNPRLGVSPATAARQRNGADFRRRPRHRT
ncbi:PLP-dependent aminotransferase family protein [Cryptosporangium aurantiacum]|uniref:Transcriptional regulator, GntR family n=1 Tax=Cryptosporangium aurantiacum TaxID=134849 RepID=A0A1M7P9G6_9ACTN|nr:PLP-dependent aminotransferase family protein [Cryptosporangium aurantiacum]SHN13334.1 transcriptional regulator, GntR family [Cryptosporangium aurantiacum]